jgi:hypothetical protein
MNIWVYVSVLCGFVLGATIFYRLGKITGIREALFQQKQMEATRLWADTINKYMGGDDVKHS